MCLSLVFCCLLSCSLCVWAHYIHGLSCCVECSRKWSDGAERQEQSEEEGKCVCAHCRLCESYCVECARSSACALQAPSQSVCSIRNQLEKINTTGDCSLTLSLTHTHTNTELWQALTSHTNDSRENGCCFMTCLRPI